MNSYSTTAKEIPKLANLTPQIAVRQEKKDASPPPHISLSNEVQDDDTMRGVKSFDEENSGKEIGPPNSEKAKTKKKPSKEEIAPKSPTPSSSTSINLQKKSNDNID